MNWSKELLLRKKEVIESLEREWLHSEICFIDTNLKLVFFILIWRDIKKSNEIFLNSNAKIDTDHAAKLSEYLEFVSMSQLCFDFQVQNLWNTEIK